MDNQLGTTNKKYISWPVIALMDFVTIMGFDDLMYPLQNQGLAVVFTWVAMIFLFVIPYEMSVTQLGATFGDRQDSGLASWVRRASHSDVLGYATAWMYWAACLPYIVDVANSTIVALGWLILGNNSLGHRMSNFMFGLLTFVVILNTRSSVKLLPAFPGNHVNAGRVCDVLHDDFIRCHDGLVTITRRPHCDAAV